MHTRMLKEHFINGTFTSSTYLGENAIIKRNIDELDKSLSAYANKCDFLSLLFLITYYINTVYMRCWYISDLLP